MASAPSVATYTNDPGAIAIDRVRLEVGDVDCDVAKITDAEIQLYLERYGVTDSSQAGVLHAAADCARAIAAKMASKVDWSQGSVKKNESQRAKAYQDLAAAIQRRANLPIPVSMAQTKADKQALEEDSGLVQPHITVGIHDNPRSNPASSDPTDT